MNRFAASLAFTAITTVAVAASVTGCSSSSSGGQKSAAATNTAANTSSASGAPASGSPATAVSVASGALLKSSQITFCSDISSPPLEFYDANQKPVGAEVELGDALAKAMGVKAVWANTAFSGIIPALQAKQCDAILSELYIKPERQKVVDFVPYMNNSNTVLIKASSVATITGAAALCGKKAAAETGTTAATYLQSASKTCKSSGKGAIDIRLFAKDSDALQQLKIGLVDAYGTTLESAAYLIKQQPNTFATAGAPFGLVQCGIATRKDNPNLSSALTAALKAVQGDGTYASILKKWNLTGDALSAR